MNKHTFIIFTVTIIVLASISVSTGGEMKTIKFETGLLESIQDSTEAEPYIPTGSLTFTVVGAPELVDNVLRIYGVLKNSSSEEVSLTVFPVGGVNPFFMDFLPKEGITKKPYFPPRPPSPPRKMKLSVPGNTAMEFSYALELDQYEYEGTPEVSLRWSFHYWMSEVSGEFPMTLTKKE